MTAPATDLRAAPTRTTSRRSGLVVFPGVSFVILVSAAAVALASDRIFDAVAAALGLLVFTWWWKGERSRASARVASPTDRAPTKTRARRLLDFALYLSPVILLSVAYPLASTRLAHDHLDGVPLTTLLLASSVTVPWLTQAVCLPLYRSISAAIDTGDPELLMDRFCDVWPGAFLESLPTVAVFAVPVAIATGWSLPVLATYVLLCVLYVAFAQSLILSIVRRNRSLWAIGWASLAATLLLAPALWYLPPLVALATQVFPLRHRFGRIRRPVALHRVDVATDLLRGLILGSVLWADKFLLFIRDGSHFAVTTVFLGLLPAILVYNYYFVRLAPDFDAAVGALRRAMETDTYSTLAARSEAVSAYVAYSLNRTGVVGTVLVFVVTLAATVVAPSSVALVTTVAIASWFFMMTTLLCYKLDYIGQRRSAQYLSAAHLLGCIVAFSLLAVGPALYGVLIGMELLIFAAAFSSVRTQWRSSEYHLFWRHATAW
jgi:hypothetical protein